MNLSVKERLSILQMLPQSGSILEMVDIMEIAKKVRLTSEEKDKIEYKEKDASVTWNVAKDEGKEIEFSHEEVTILKSSVKRLDEERKVNPSNLDICLKINSL